MEPPGIYGVLSILKLLDSGAISHKLCELCANFRIGSTADESPTGILLPIRVSNHEIRQEYTDFSPAFLSIRKREKRGCVFCSFIANSLRVELRKRARWLLARRRPVRIVLSASMLETVEHGSTLAMYRDKGPHILKVKVLNDEDGESEEIVSYDITFQTCSEPTVTAEKPLSDTNISLVNQWLSDCSTNHSSCQEGLTCCYTPTRLLAVQDELLRLVTGEIGNPRYVALSYCWGETRNKGTLTTMSNIVARSSGLVMDELSRTHQDAIRITRALGIDYIWIDAVCIIQDDPGDWSREASRMGDVYKHAYLTIASTTTISSSYGFLRNRDPCFTLSLEFNFEELQTIRAQPETERSGKIHFRYPPERAILDDLSECKWSKRGWTLQEQLLSTRMLYFTKDVLYYECGTTQQAENSGYKLPERLSFGALVANRGNSKPVENDGQRRNLLSGWYKIVMLYTKRSVTNALDKLPAVQGMAETYKRVINDDYIYGLWKSDLHMGLLWRGGAKRYQRYYRAPSWSWASLDGPVSWDKSSFSSGWKSLITDLNVSVHQQCTHCDETIGARLELTAPLAPLKDVLLFYDNLMGSNDYDEEDFTELDHWGGFDAFGLFKTDLESDMPIVLAGTEMMLVAEKDETQNIQAIIIQSFGSSHHFKRIGRFILKETAGKMTEYDWDDRDFDEIRNLFKTGKRVLV